MFFFNSAQRILTTLVLLAFLPALILIIYTGTQKRDQNIDTLTTKTLVYLNAFSTELKVFNENDLAPQNWSIL